MKNRTAIRPALFIGIAAGLLLLAALFVIGRFILSPLQAGTPDQSKGSAAAQAEEDPFDAIFADAQASAIAEAALRHHSPPAVLEDVEGVTVELLPVNEYSRPGVPLENVNAIVIHYTGNPGTTAQQNRDYFASLADSGNESVSSHFVIGIDGEIIQCIPLDEKSYYSNHRNRDTISIECCHPDETGKFTDETLESLVTLTRYLADSYDLGEEDVIRHYDVTGKLCPLYYVEHEDEWEALKAEIFAS
ncbi:MAG: N-acetylmuramoyl-L-alanine amidase [Oscillospiraceae bacterium]|nr:N-acetylmuramoyl-L-alanine amidase [Oscillospiraceae bacterium]